MTGSLTGTGSFAEVFLAAIGAPDPCRPRLRVLDVGTGTARIPIAICKQRGRIELTAVDRGAGVVRRARHRVAQAGFDDVIHIDRADAGALPYAAGSFDAVISNGLVHHVPDRRGVLCEMVRVLRPGGLLFVRDSLPQSDAATIARVLSRDCGACDRSRHAVFQSRFQWPLSIDEVRALASAAALPAEWVRQTGRRHWLIAGRRTSGTGCQRCHAMHVGTPATLNARAG